MAVVMRAPVTWSVVSGAPVTWSMAGQTATSTTFNVSTNVDVSVFYTAHIPSLRGGE